MICISKTLLEERVDNAVKRIYTGKGVFGCIESLKMEFDNEDDEDYFYGTMVIRYGRYDVSNREDLNFSKTIVVNVDPKVLDNYDFFEGVIYALIEQNDR